MEFSLRVNASVVIAVAGAEIRRGNVVLGKCRPFHLGAGREVFLVRCPPQIRSPLFCELPSLQPPETTFSPIRAIKWQLTKTGCYNRGDPIPNAQGLRVILDRGASTGQIDGSVSDESK